ncbi:hypothetical protein GGR57DRAFT_121866 [Xylariaceae sp. FL1272]|nr:hypothetical protein GGR57DRAFT_121866 [Xylariaceae sp. FL1272]
MAHVTNNNVTLIGMRKRSLVPEKWEDQYLLEAENLSDDETKWRLHVDIFNYIVAAHCLKGAVTTIGPDYEGVALWMPPGKDADDFLTILRSGMWRLYYQLSAEGRRRYYTELLPLLHDTKHEVMGERDSDCYYLVYLGTKPSGQKRGYGRKLIEHMAAKADAEGRAMYLESSSEKNNQYYKKFGFEVKRNIYMGVNGNISTSAEAPVTLTIMVREPRKLAPSKSIPMKLQPGFPRRAI